MELEKAVELVLRAEKIFFLFDRKAFGVPVWERIRKHVVNILQHGQKTINSHSVGSPLGKIEKITKYPWYSLPCDGLVFGVGRRKWNPKGYWVDIYTDPIIKLFPGRIVSVEEPFRGVHMQPTETENLYYTDFYAAIWSRTKLLYYKKAERYSNMFSDVQDYLNNLGGNINIAELVVKTLARRNFWVPRFIGIIKRLKPKIIIIICSYGGREDIIEAAKILNIPTVEFQHGVLSNYHLGYSYPEECPKYLFPNYFCTFGNYWKESIYWSIDPSHVLNVGYPHLELSLKAMSRSITKKKQILFFSQLSIGAILSEFACRVADRLSGDYQVLYKLHPKEKNGRELYPRLVNSNVKVVENDGSDLYTLMAESCIQIGGNSTALYEGLRFGLVTYLYKPAGIELVKEMVERGWARIITHPNEIDPSCTSSNIDVSSVFKSDWENRFYEVIKQINKNEGLDINKLQSRY